MNGNKNMKVMLKDLADSWWSKNRETRFGQSWGGDCQERKKHPPQKRNPNKQCNGGSIIYEGTSHKDYILNK